MANLAVLCLTRILPEDRNQKGNPDSFDLRKFEPVKETHEARCLTKYSQYILYEWGPRIHHCFGGEHPQHVFPDVQAAMIWNDCLVNHYGAQFDYKISFFFC